MECPACHAENPSESKLCLGCGARLALACGTCGAELPAESRYCYKCGSPLGTRATALPRFAAPESYTPKHLAEKILTSRSALEGERKQVTVLFADLRGSMELLADRDPEEARELLDPVLDRMMDAVHRYEGTVNQVMGDGIMALFGAPLAHEDHAVRACYAALRMQEGVKRYSAEVQRKHGVILRIRVGLNSGEVVVRTIGSDLRMDYTAVGKTTHLAARLEQLADPGSILVSPNTLRLAEGYLRVKPLGRVPVKGLAEPVEVYEVTGEGPVRTRFQAAATRGLTRFVGREAELEQLRRALERAGEGDGQAVAGVGQAGVGKSRLFYEFVHSHLTQGWHVLESGSVSYGKATSYLPIIDLLRAHFKIQDRDECGDIRDNVRGTLLALDRALEPLAPALLALLDVPPGDLGWEALDPPQRRQCTLNAITRLLLRESQARPLLLVVEDLHWIDGETQAFLDTLIERLPTARVLLLVNYRPEYQHTWGGRTYFTELRLDALPPESAGELLHMLLGDDAELEHLKAILITRTGGNPFFLEESVRTLVETKALVGERGAYSLAQPGARIQLPATVQAVLAARVDRLPSEEKRLLQAAAVIGKDVPFVLLHAIANLPEADLRRRLTHLQAGEFLREAQLFPDVEYTFKHALTHEVAYQSLLQERRQALHGRIVETIERLQPDIRDRQPEILARHYTLAGMREPAIAWWLRAGQKAIERSANVDAAAHLTSGLALLETLPACLERTQQELRLRLALGTALVAHRGYGAPEVEQNLIRVHELTAELGEAPELTPVLFGLWRFYLARADLSASEALAARLLAAAARHGDRQLLVPAHTAAGITAFYLGHFSQARGHLEEVQGLHDSSQGHQEALVYGQDLGVGTLGYLGWLLTLMGYFDRGAEAADRALERARSGKHGFTLALALLSAGLVRCARREAALVERYGEELLTLSRELGFQFFSALAVGLSGWALFTQGDAKRGVALMREGADLYRATNQRIGLRYRAELAEALAQVGAGDEALTVLEEAVSHARATRESAFLSEIYRVKGEALLRRSRTDAQAEALLTQAVALASEQGAALLTLRAATSLVRLQRERGRPSEADATLDQICASLSEGFDLDELKAARSLIRLRRP